MASNILLNFIFAGNAAQLQAASQQANSALNSTNRTLLENRVRFLAATAAITGFVGGLTGAIKSAIETSAEFQRLGTSFVSILAEPLIKVKDGAALTAENLKVLRAESVNLFREAQRAAIDTVATTEEYVKLLQAALAVGQQQGLTQEQTLIITKRLALAAGSFGIDFEKASTAIAQILSGSVRVTNQLGRNLGLATDEQRKALKAAQQTGHIYEFLEAKTRNFSVTAKEVADNFVNVAAAVRDVFQLGGTAAVKPLFDFLNKELIKFRDNFIGDGGEFFAPALQRIIEGFQNFFKEVVPTLRPLVDAFGDLFSEIGGQGDQISFAFRAIITALTEIVKLLSQAVGLKGFGGILLGAYAFLSVYSRALPLVQQVTAFIGLQRNAQQAQLVVQQAQNVALTAQAYTTGLVNAVMTRYAATGVLTAGATAAVTNAVQAEVLAWEQLAIAQQAATVSTNAVAVAQTGLLARFGPIVLVIGVVATLLLTMASNTDEAAKALDRLNEASEKFNENQREFAANRNLQTIVDDYKRLSDQQKLNYEDATRLAYVTQVLKENLGEAGFVALAAGKSFDFAFGQKRLNIGLDERIADLERLKKITGEFIQNQNRGFFSFDLNRTSADELEGLKDLFRNFDKQKKELRDLAKIYFPDLTEAELQNSETLKQLFKDAEKASAQFQHQKGTLDLLTKSTKELFDAAYDASIQDSKSEEGKKRLASISAALYTHYLNEANGNRLVAKAAVESALIVEKAELAKLDKIQLNNDALIRQGLLFQFTAEEAAGLGLPTTEDQRNRRKLNIAELEGLLGRFSIHPSASTKEKKQKSGRDELNDFVKSLEQQLSVLKKISDLIEKEADRIVDHRTKILQALEDSGTIPFQVGLNLEENLIYRAKNINQDLANARKELIAADIELVKIVAARQSDRDQTKATGRTAPDTRQRQLEAAEKLYTEKLATYIKSLDDLRKVEQEIFEIGQRAARNRIANRQAELAANDALREEAAKDAAERAKLLEGVGVLSPEAAALKEFDASRVALQNRKNEITRTLFPQTDPVFRQELLNATDKISTLIGTSLDETKLAELEAAVKQMKQLTATLESLNTSRAGNLKRGENTSAVEEQIRNLEETIAKVGSGLIGDLATTKELGDAFATLNALNIPRAKQLELFVELRKVENQQTLDQVKHEFELFKFASDRLALEQQFVDAGLQRLDIITQIVDKQHEFGQLNELQFANQSSNLIKQRLLLLEQQKLILQQQFNADVTIPRSLGGNNPQTDRRAIELQGQLNTVALTMFNLKNQAFELNSPLIGLRDAFKAIGDSVGNLPAPFNKLKGIFTGLETLLNALANRGRPKAPEIVLQESANKFSDVVNTFQKAVDQFALLIQQLLGTSTGTGVDNVASGVISLGGAASNDAKAAGQKVKTDTKAKIVSIIRAAGQTVAGVLGAIANKDIGQGIAAFGSVASLIPVAGPFIAAGLEIVGGIVSFFGESAKKKTQEMAETINEGISDLKDAISSGAIGLGEGIRALQDKLEDARRSLSGRKGGEEELKKIEDDIEAEKKRLRAEAKKIQDDFRDQLDILRSPANLRDTISAINNIADSAKKFIKSFENPEDALAAVKEAQEFVQLSIKEIKDDIQKTLRDLQQNLRDATEKFATDQKAILLEGRIDPRVSEAESKRQRLVLLEREFQKNRIDLENQISGEQKKLDYVNQRDKIEEKIARLAQLGAEALGGAADKLNTAALNLDKAFQRIGNFAFGQEGSSSTVTLNLRVNGQEAGSTSIGIDSITHLDMAGLLSPSRLSRFNPLVNR